MNTPLVIDYIDWLHLLNNLPDTDFSVQLIDYLANRFSPLNKRLICHHAENF